MTTVYESAPGGHGPPGNSTPGAGTPLASRPSGALAYATAPAPPPLVSAHSAPPVLTATDNTPVATSSVVNKVATASSSIYQNCRVLLLRLAHVDGFSARFSAPESPDPVSRALTLLRLGSSLCYLFNQLHLPHKITIPVADPTNIKACQRATAHFIMACKQHLDWSDSDLFAIHELYGQDTNGNVKPLNTASKLLDLLQSQGVLVSPTTDALLSEPADGPLDDRAKIVREILISERKYVQDLEVLQNYQRLVQSKDVLTQDQNHNLFMNLNMLADFQRRFLIGVEANATLPAEDQRFGALFLQMEENFSVYEPYCANLTAAQDLAVARIAELSQLAGVLDPISELGPMLIKPVQRLCKYPLLISTLVKNTPETHPHYDELNEGLAAIVRVTEKVNETKRKEDNRQAVTVLDRRVEDWKGHDLASFGELLLHETFTVLKGDSERDYLVYLFERILLCCKEVSPSKKTSKSNSILKKSSASISGTSGLMSTAAARRNSTPLQLKGRIFVNNVTGARVVNRPTGSQHHLLEVRWRGDVAEEAFVIKCRTEELLKQWQRAINRVVEDVAARRRLGKKSLTSNGHPPYPASHQSPHSQFPPPTPQTESSASSYQFPDVGSPDSSASPYANGFAAGYAGSSYATGSANGFTASTSGSVNGYASGSQTNYTNSSQTHYASGSQSGYANGAYTGNPSSFGSAHTSTHSSTHSSGNAAPAYGYGSGSFGTNGFPFGNGTLNPGTLAPEEDDNGKRRANAARSMPTSERAMNALMSGGALPDDEPTSRPRAHTQDAQALHSARGALLESSLPYSGASHLPYTRTNSSAASLRTQESLEWVGQRISGSAGSHTGSHAGHGSTFSSRRGSGLDDPTLTMSVRARSTSSPHAPRIDASTTTLASSQRSSDRPFDGRTASTSALRIKIEYGDDSYIVVALNTITSAELVDKVLKKIQSVTNATAPLSPRALKLRYQDEDGDRILITSDEDIAMALEVAVLETHAAPTLAIIATIQE